MPKLQSSDDLCRQVLMIDSKIRFVAVANEIGKIVSSEYRKGLEPLLTKEESELSVIQSAIRMGTRKTLEEKIGKTVYAAALYEKVKRASIPLDNSILMVSFDIDCEHERVILEKIIPLSSKFLGIK